MSVDAKEQVAAFYEQFQARKGKYDYLYGDEARKDLFIQLIGQGKNVLEVGCRAGNLTQHYAANNRVTGVDVDRHALRLFAQRFNASVHWVDIDLEPLPFPNDSFEVVVFSE